MDTQINDNLIEKIKVGELCYADISEEFKLDRNILKEALLVDGKNIIHADSSFSNDKEIILTALKSYEHVIDFMNKKFLDDEEVVLSLMRHYEGYLDMASLRIYKLCMAGDPINVLSAVVAKNNLSEHLEVNKNTTVRKLKV